MFSYTEILGVEKENERDKESEDLFLNLTVEKLMQINISQKIIEILHQYTLRSSTPTTTTNTTSTSTSTSIPTTSHYSALCVSLFTNKGFSHLINERYEMLESNYPVLSPEESTVRDHLKAYVQSYSNKNK